jgi:hypothetical protein
MNQFVPDERQIAPREIDIADLHVAIDRVDVRAVRTLAEHWLSVALGGVLAHDAHDAETLHALVRCQGVRNFISWLEDVVVNR